MSKKTIIIIIATLVVIIGIFAYLNSSYIKGKKEILENVEIAIKSDESETVFDLSEIKRLGEEEFKANLKSSGNPSEEHSYIGVPLKNVIEEAGADIEGKTQVIARSIDGFAVALNMDEVLEDDNIYLAYMMDGKQLKGREEGGSGPYQVIIRKDPFSQRWAKYVVEIEVQ